MSQNVQLQQVVVNGVIVKMCSDNIRGHIVGRMLHRSERIDILSKRQHHNTPWMLSCTSSDPCHPCCQALHLALAPVPLPLLKIVLHIPESRLIRKGCNGSRPEGLPCAEDNLRVLMSLGLVLTGKIQVDIRLLVPLKPQECLKRNVKSLLVKLLPTDRTVPVRHVHPRLAPVSFYIFFLKIHIVTFAAVIMGTQGVDLRDARHGGHKRASHTSPGSHQVSILHGFPHQFLSNDVHHRKAILDDGVQFPLQTRLHDSRQLGPIDLMGLVITDLGQGLVAVFNNRRTFVRAHRKNGLHHVSDHIGIFDHDFKGFVTAQVRTLLQHFLGGVEEQGRLVVGILKSSARHDNAPVHLVLRVKKMHITGGHHRLMKLLSQFHNAPVHILNILQGLDAAHPFRRNHKFIVPHRLDLQIVIKIYNSGYLHITLAVQ